MSTDEIAEKHLLLTLEDPAHIAGLLAAKDWPALLAVIQYAQRDVPREMAITDPERFGRLRTAITQYCVNGYGALSESAVRARLQG